MNEQVKSAEPQRLSHKQLQRARKKKYAQKKLFILLTLAFTLGFAAGILVGSSKETEINFVMPEIIPLDQAAETATSTDQNKLPENLPWYLTLVNFEHELPEDFAPETLTLADNGYETDSRISEAVKTMIADARKEKVRIIAVSAFRDYAYQKELYENKVQRLQREKGYSVDKARVEAATVVAYPGTSEHQLGLALDLVDARHVKLDTSQENTTAYKWLYEHCAEYGFIVRYPNGKTDITGIIYEPWHFRYVGVDAAKVIMENDITLEEYLLDYYEP